jgi:hypothetical protein
LAFFPPDLNSHELELVAALAATARLPNPRTVAELPEAIFPSVRGPGSLRMTIQQTGGKSVLFDDNVTPKWALLWSHGMTKQLRTSGWTVAHVWPQVKCPDCYTRLANLALIPECLAGLSDKQGPATAYLRYHAQEVYGWSPAGSDTIGKPRYYDNMDWHYLEYAGAPREVIAEYGSTLYNQRIELLRQLNWPTWTGAC